MIEQENSAFAAFALPSGGLMNEICRIPFISGWTGKAVTPFKIHDLLKEGKYFDYKRKST